MFNKPCIKFYPNGASVQFYTFNGVPFEICGTTTYVSKSMESFLEDVCDMAREDDPDAALNDPEFQREDGRAWKEFLCGD